MRGALHVLATITLVPYVLLAAGFVLLGQAISSGSLLSFLETLLLQATWLVPWGVIGFPIPFLLLAALGLHSRSRWIAGLLLCLIASTCGVIIFLMSTSAIGVGEVLFLLPCITVVIFGGWLVVVERRVRHVGGNAA